LRLDLERQGIGGRDARELLATLDWDSALTAAGGESGSLLDDAASPRNPSGGGGQEGEP
jgi:hypothetical protein